MNDNILPLFVVKFLRLRFGGVEGGIFFERDTIRATSVRVGVRGARSKLPLLWFRPPLILARTSCLNRIHVSRNRIIFYPRENGKQYKVGRRTP